jgi:hypothetical protein
LQRAESRKKDITNNITATQKEQLVNDLVKVQKEELQITLAEWRAMGYNRKQLREAERTQLAKIKVDTRRMVEQWYGSSQ